MDIKLLIIPSLIVFLIVTVLFLALFIIKGSLIISNARKKRLFKKHEDIINMFPDAETRSNEEIVERLKQVGKTNNIEAILDKGAELSGSSINKLMRFYDAAGITDKYIKQLESSHSWEKRAFAAERLGHIGSANAVPALLSIITNAHNEDEDVRSSALRALGRVCDTRAIPFLIDALGSPRTWLPPRVAEILVNIGDETIAPLQRELKNSKNETRRGWAAEILGWLKADSAVMPLIDALSDVNPDVRARASGALGKIKDSRSVNKLLELLISDPVPFVRVKASHALGLIGHPSIIDYCITVLKDPEWWVRVRAVEALSELGENAVPALLIALEDKDMEVCKSAAMALERIGYIDNILDDYEQKEYKPDINNILLLIARTGAIETIIDRLDHASLHLKKRIVRVLGEAKIRKTGEPLLELLNNSRDWILTSRIITSLGRIGIPEAVPVLIKYLKADKYWVRRSAVEALGMLKADDNVDDIAAILTDPHQHAREAALNALLELGIEGVNDQIEARLFDPSSKVRRAALKAARKLKLPADKGTVTSLLTDKNLDVRIQAIKYLASCNHPNDIENIVRLIPYGPNALRQEIVCYIKKIIPISFQKITGLLDMNSVPADAMPCILEIASLIKDEHALEFTMDLTKSPDVRIREKAFSVISRFEFEEKGPVLEKGLFDSSESVRITVLTSLAVNPDYNILKKAALLARDPSEDVRVALTLACGVSGNTEFRSLVNEMLNDPSIKVRSSALLSIAAFNDPSLPEYLYAQKNIMQLKNEVNRISNDTRFRNIIKSIKSFSERSNSLIVDFLLAGDNKAFSARLIKKLSGELDPEVRITAIDLLKTLATADIFLSVLGISRKDPSAEVRLRAMDLLVTTGRKNEVISALSSMLFDPAVKVRIRATELLGTFDHPDALSSLLHALDTTDRHFRESVTTSLSRLLSKDPLTFRTLVRSIPETKTRKLGMTWLAGKTRTSGSVRFLLMLLNDSDPDVRASAVGALAKFRNQRLIPSLEKLVYDPNERVRSATINALSGIKPPMTFDIIKHGLEDLIEFVRIRAAVNLAKLDVARAIEAVKKHSYKSPDLGSCLKGMLFAAGISYDESIQRDDIARNVLNELCPDNEMVKTFSQSPDKSRRLHSLRVLKLFREDKLDELTNNALRDPCPAVRNEAKKYITH